MAVFRTCGFANCATLPGCTERTMSVSVMAYRCAKTLIHTTVCSRSDRVSSDILQRDQLCADVVSRTQCPTRCVSDPTFVARRAAFATQRQLPYEQLRKRWGPGCSVLLALRHGLCVGEGLRETPETHPVGWVRVANIDHSYRAVFQSTVCGVWLYETTQAQPQTLLTTRTVS